MSNNNKGFSLVELMVVVAVIGFLAAIAIPQYAIYRMKTFQSEAKTSLSSLYVAEQAFFGEYNRYHTSWIAIGFSPTGNARYNVGFGDFGVVADSSHGYHVNLDWAQQVSMSSIYYCAGVGANITNANECFLMEDEAGVGRPLLPVTWTTTETGFVAGASYTFANNSYLADNSSPARRNAGTWALLGLMGISAQALAPASPPMGTALDDQWMIDNFKNLRNRRLTY